MGERETGRRRGMADVDGVPIVFSVNFDGTVRIQIDDTFALKTGLRSARACADLGYAEREEFSRLYAEAVRQAEAGDAEETYEADGGDTMHDVTDEPRIYPCPLPTCHWATLSEPPGPAENPGALAEQFGWGVFAAHARADRLTRKERELAGHLATHTLTEFAIALAEANKQTAALGTVFGPISGTSRQIGREWQRMRPGVQARLLCLGLVGDEPIAWIDVRDNPDG